MAELDDGYRSRREKIEDFQAALVGFDQSHRNADEDAHDIRVNEAFLHGEFRHSGLDEVAQSLRSNFMRLYWFSSMPQSLFEFGRVYQHAYALLCAEYGRDQAPASCDAYVCESGNPPTSEWRNATVAIGEALRQWTIGQRELPVRYPTVACFEASAFAGRALEPREQQIQSFISSIVIQAWTLFESFCEDLWEAAVNFYPSKLADIPKFKMSFDELSRHGFDLRSTMGTALVRANQNEVSFRSLFHIQSTYTKAFSEQNDAIRGILESPQLRYAAAVRNLLIHKRGIADDEFVKDVGGFTFVPAVAVGEPFPLTGKISALLLTCCRRSSFKLLLAVHSWIDGHRNLNNVRDWQI